MRKKKEEKSYYNIFTDIYNELVNEMITHLELIKENEELEEYEICESLHKKIINIIRLKSIQLSEYTELSIDNLIEMFTEDYNKLKLDINLVAGIDK